MSQVPFTITPHPVYHPSVAAVPVKFDFIKSSSMSTSTVSTKPASPATSIKPQAATSSSPASADDILKRTKAAQEEMKRLKASGASSEQIQQQAAVLKALQDEKKALGGAEDDSKKFSIKVPKGTKDYNEREMAIREKIFATITKVFKRHGAVTIDTPVFELKVNPLLCDSYINTHFF